MPEASDVDGVNVDRLEEHGRAVCPTPVACAACPTQRNPDLFSTCAEDSCTVVDISSDPASACASDDDCRVRVAGCCECGGSTAVYDLIAVNRSEESRYAAMVCDPMQACDDCAPIYPADAKAHCATDGHCKVRVATSSPVCRLPFDPGPCDAAIAVFAFFDGACVERTYGGCEGNDNRFPTIEDCVQACGGST
jgi:hypothetical protein